MVMFIHLIAQGTGVHVSVGLIKRLEVSGYVAVLSTSQTGLSTFLEVAAQSHAPCSTATPQADRPVFATAETSERFSFLQFAPHFQSELSLWPEGLPCYVRDRVCTLGIRG